MLKWLVVAIALSSILTIAIYGLCQLVGITSFMVDWVALIVAPAAAFVVVYYKNAVTAWLSLLFTIPLGFFLIFWSACAIAGRCL